MHIDLIHVLFLFVLCWCSAAHERVEVGKKSLGHFATQAKAFRKCEEVIKVRYNNLKRLKLYRNCPVLSHHFQSKAEGNCAL